MTKQEFMDELGTLSSEGVYYVYTGIPGQTIGEFKYFYGVPTPGRTGDDLDLLEKIFESFVSEYPDGIEDVVVVDVGKISLKGGVLTTNFTDTTIY